MRPLNFLHLTTFYPPYSFGGDAIYVQKLCGALAARGHHVEVVHCIDAYSLRRNAAPGAGSPGDPRVITHPLRSPLRWLSPVLAQQTGQAWGKRKAIERVLSSRKFDVVHYHNISLLGPDALRLRTNLGGAVKIYTAHEHWLICPMHVLAKFGTRPCDEPECLRCTLGHLRPPQWWRYTPLLAHAAAEVDVFVTASRFAIRLHAERGFPRKLEYLPSFCEPGGTPPAMEEARVRERPYFLYVGRLEYIKGVHTLIETWKRDLPFDLIVAGAGSFQAKLQTMAAGNPRVRFAGAQHGGALDVLYRQALALIVPSVAYEVFPLVNIEAFARRTPVIVRALGGLPEVVEASGGGLCFRNQEELLDALHRIHSSPEFRADLGERGYRAYLARWSTEAHLEQYTALVTGAARRKFGRIPWEEGG